MTCIIGLVHEGDIYMGGDSACINGGTMAIREDPKVFTKEPFIFGFSGSFRMGQLLRFSFNPPPIDCDIYEYMCTSFIDGVRECFKKGGYASTENEEEVGGTFLVGVKGRLFKVECDYQVGEVYLGFDSIGSGEQCAKGSLFTTHNKNNIPLSRITIALEAAKEFSSSVDSPFNIERLECI